GDVRPAATRDGAAPGRAGAGPGGPPPGRRTAEPLWPGRQGPSPASRDVRRGEAAGGRRPRPDQEPDFVLRRRADRLSRLGARPPGGSTTVRRGSRAEGRRPHREPRPPPDFLRGPGLPTGRWPPPRVGG